MSAYKWFDLTAKAAFRKAKADFALKCRQHGVTTVKLVNIEWSLNETTYFITTPGMPGGVGLSSRDMTNAMKARTRKTFMEAIGELFMVRP